MAVIVRFFEEKADLKKITLYSDDEKACKMSDSVEE